jgi:hypothetical protein
MVPFGTIPSVISEVVALNGTVPLPVAGVGTVLGFGVDALELLDDAELEGDEFVDEELDEVDVALEPPLIEVSALCTAAESWVFTRSSAVWLAMLASPLDSEVSAEPI